MRARLVLLLCVGMGTPFAHAHPHAWIELRSTILLIATGRVSGIEQEWLFDEFYSLFATEEISKASGSQAEALRALARENLNNLHEYDDYTEPHASGARVKFDKVSEFETQMRGPRLWMRFVVPVVTRVDPVTSAFSVSIFDPTYYIEIRHADGDAIAVRNVKAGDCSSRLQPPRPTAEAMLMAQAMDRNATPDATVGKIFAEQVHITCQ